MPAVPGRRALRRAASLALLLFVAVAACAQRQPPPPLTLATSAASLSLPIHVADDNGYFAAEGVAVNLRECLGGFRCLRMMFDGQADLATAADMPIVVSSFERDDYAVLATFATSSRNEKLLTRKSAGITEPVQLEGRRVGTVKGTSAHYFLDIWLLFNGIDPKRVVIVPLNPEQAPGAIERREVDAVAVYEPYAFRALELLGSDARLLPSARIYSASFNLVASRHTIAARLDDLQKVLRALLRAEAFIREQPLKAQALMKARLKLGQDYIDWDWPHLEFRIALDQSLIATMEGEARWALREGHVAADRRPPNYLRFIEAGPLRSVAPGAVTLLERAAR